MFSGEGSGWLQTMTVSGYSGVSHFSDATLRQVEGAYGAQTVAGGGELRLNGTVPERWRVSLPVGIVMDFVFFYNYMFLKELILNNVL